MIDSDNNSDPPALKSLLHRAAMTSLGAVYNRTELFLTELQEEKILVIELFLWAGAACFLGMMFLVVLTGTIIFLFPEDWRVYAAGGFCVLYLLGAILAFLNLKALVKSSATPFPDTIAEVKKDQEWLESLK